MILCCWRDLQQLHDSIISENELIKRPVTSENVRPPPPVAAQFRDVAAQFSRARICMFWHLM